MNISKRVQALSTSPIRRLVPYATVAKAKGKKVYHLNIGQPDIETPMQFMESIRKFDEKVISYGNSQGEMVLIEAVKKYYKEWNMHFDNTNIYVTNGGSEALTLAIMTLCDPGDEVLVFEPYYANYKTFANTYNVNINAVATTAENGYRLPSETEIEKKITPRTKAILITNPGNPTGVVFTEEEMQMISRLVLKYDLGLIADEVYREFVYDGAYKSFGHMPELEQNLVIVDSVSKRYSACGARIGCLLSHNDAFCKELMKCCQARLCCPTLEQVGAAALYTTPKTYLDAVNKEYKKRRDTIASALAKVPDVLASNPSGAFYVMVKLPVDDAEKFAIWLLEEFDVDGETVMFAPGNGFYDTEGRGVDEARLAYVLKSEDLEKAIAILAAGLKAYPGKK
ncbi:MAG TPA: pyridoxal phosphate-dependent aminotransferase [Candidatus Avacidaminococcus intestinavium]|uniref:Aminotransferase n=1 Tax=Candidatus Avacidaminococcus intestinavium TaxID=2840684 RepID=A0A9D1SKB3_9FIRM|nr:pyridoxal phosphate-dependent aminotransferase [Candidatus Avacidaminococcus intestinavium]